MLVPLLTSAPHEPKVFNFLEVLQKLDFDEFVLPTTQRDFVWTAKKVKKLMDSLLRNYIIGGFIILPSIIENSELDRNITIKELDNKEKSKVKRNDSIKKLLFVIDGQQRLTSLKKLFLTDKRNNKEEDVFYLDLESFIPYCVYDLANFKIKVVINKKQEKELCYNMKSSRKKEDETKYLDLSEVYIAYKNNNSIEIENFWKKIIKRIQQSNYYKEYNDEQKNVIDINLEGRLTRIFSSLFQVRFTFTEVDRGITDDDLEENFKRINDCGVKLNLMDLINSTSYDKETKTTLIEDLTSDLNEKLNQQPHLKEVYKKILGFKSKKGYNNLISLIKILSINNEFESHDTEKDLIDRETFISYNIKNRNANLFRKEFEANKESLYKIFNWFHKEGLEDKCQTNLLISACAIILFISKRYRGGEIIVSEDPKFYFIQEKIRNSLIQFMLEGLTYGNKPFNKAMKRLFIEIKELVTNESNSSFNLNIDFDYKRDLSIEKILNSNLKSSLGKYIKFCIENREGDFAQMAKDFCGVSFDKNKEYHYHHIIPISKAKNEEDRKLFNSIANLTPLNPKSNEKISNYDHNYYLEKNLKGFGEGDYKKLLKMNFIPDNAILLNEKDLIAERAKLLLKALKSTFAFK